MLTNFHVHGISGSWWRKNICGRNYAKMDKQSLLFKYFFEDDDDIK